MNTTQLVSAIQFWDRFDISLYLRVLESKYNVTIKNKFLNEKKISNKRD
jgi:hypothetical protein